MDFSFKTCIWISKKNDDFSEKKTSCHGPVLKFEKALQTHSTQFGTSKVSTMNCFCHFKKKVNTRKGASINYVHKHKDGFTQISTILLHKLMQSTCQRKVSESSKPVNVVYRYPKEKVASTSTL